MTLADRGDIALLDQRDRNARADRDAWRAADRARGGRERRSGAPQPARYVLRSGAVGQEAETGGQAHDAIALLGGEVVDASTGMLLFDASPGIALAIARRFPGWRVSPETRVETAIPRRARRPR